MALFLFLAISNMPAWAAFLRSTATDTMARSSCVVAPSRRASLRLTSLAPNRHTCAAEAACRQAPSLQASCAHPDSAQGCSCCGTRAAFEVPRAPSLAEGRPASSSCRVVQAPWLEASTQQHPGNQAPPCWRRHLEVAVGHEAQAVAVPAEGLRHGRDEGHAAHKAPHPEVLRHLALGVCMPLQALQDRTAVGCCDCRASSAAPGSVASDQSQLQGHCLAAGWPQPALWLTAWSWHCPGQILCSMLPQSCCEQGVPTCGKAAAMASCISL